MTHHDPIEALRAARPTVDAADPHVRSSARDGMFTEPRAAHEHRRRNVAAGGLVALAAVSVAVVLIARPFAAPDDASAAAVERLASVASKQSTIATPGKRQWVISRLRTTHTWTQNLTQARLDELTRNQVAIIDARNRGLGGRAVPNPRKSKAQQRRDARSMKRLQDRADARVRAGVKLSDLPAQTIVGTRDSEIAAYRNDRGEGGAGGVEGENADWKVHYLSDAQARAAKMLERAQIGGAHADPSSAGGFEASIDSTYRAPRAARIKSLSNDQVTLRAQLLKSVADGAARDDESEQVELFKLASSIVGSPYTSPAVRSASIKLIAAIPGVSVATDAVDQRGRHGLGLSIAIRGGTEQLIFDEADSRLLGFNTRIDDPVEFVGKSTFGGQDGPTVLPLFDSATIKTSYDRLIVSSTRPVCLASYCPDAVTRVPNP